MSNEKKLNLKTKKVEEALNANHYLVEGVTYFVENIDVYEMFYWRHNAFKKYVEFFAPFMDAEIEHMSTDCSCSWLETQTTSTLDCPDRIYFWMTHNQERDGIRLDDSELDVDYLHEVIWKKILNFNARNLPLYSP